MSFLLELLGREEAKRLIRVAVRERFRRDYRAGRDKRIDRCARRNALRMRCRIAWSVGDLSWRGRVSVWKSRESEFVFWNYSYAIRRTNEFCKQVRQRSDCTTVYRAESPRRN